MPESIYTQYSQAIDRRGAQTWISFLFVKCRPTGRIRGSNLRVKINGLRAGEGDPTRMKFVSHGVNRKVAGRVRSVQEALVSRGSVRLSRFSNLTGQVRSGLTFCYLTGRVGSGQVGSRGFPNLAGRVGSSTHASNIRGSARVR